MTTRFALRAFLCLAFVLMSIEVWGSVALQSFGVSPSVPGKQLFNSIGPMGPPGQEAGPGATVAWPVTTNIALLNTLPTTIQVNFPDRPSVTLIRIRSERRGGTAFLWTGGSDDCAGLFSMSADGLKGTLSCDDAPYGIDHLPGSSSVRLTRYDHAGISEMTSEPVPGLLGAVPSGPTSTPPKGPVDATIDILVLFNGSIPATYIWRDAQYAVDQTQLAIDRSRAPGQPVLAQLRLAGVARISRTIADAINSDLLYLRDDPETAALRDYWAGDVIVYITVGTGTLWGLAYIPQNENLPPPGQGFAPYAIAVTLGSHATNSGEYNFAHEFAHTLGANHNQDNSPVNLTPVRPWAFGRWAVESESGHGNRTIMSYLHPPQCASPHCDRVLNYSNPGVWVDWFRTGLTNSSDNAAVIAEFAPVTAQYRDSKGRIFTYGFD